MYNYVLENQQKDLSMKTFFKFLEEYRPVQPDTLVSRNLGPQWNRRIRVYMDFHGKWESVGDFDSIQEAEPMMRHIKWAGHRVRAVPFSD